MPTKTPSMAHQAKELFDENLAIGESRHEAKRDMAARGLDPQAMTDKIHSWGAYKRELQGSIGCAKWCKQEYGIKRVVQITPDMVRAYIEYRKGSVEQNTVSADLTGIRRLDKCLQNRHPGRASIVPDDVSAPRKVSPRGAYQPAEVRSIIDYIDKRDPLTAKVLQVQQAGALRISEAVNLRSDFVDLRKGEVIVDVKGKGGKPRTVSLADRRVLGQLDLSKGKPLRDEKVTAKSQMNRIQAQVRAACRALGIATGRGTHGIRATAAIIYYKSLVVRGMSKRQALSATGEYMGHGKRRWDVLRTYLGNDLVDEALGE
jgi:integrase